MRTTEMEMGIINKCVWLLSFSKMLQHAMVFRQPAFISLYPSIRGKSRNLPTNTNIAFVVFHEQFTTLELRPSLLFKL